MRIRLLAPIALLVFLCGTAQAQVPSADQQCSVIRATFLGGERLSFPGARITLRVNESSDLSLLDVRERMIQITAENYLYKTNGKVDFNDKRNIGAIAAYYLLQGDEIRGKLFSGSSAPGREGPWYISEIERIYPWTPPSPMPGPLPGPVRKTNVQGNLRFTMEVGQPEYRAGEQVPMTFVVENTGPISQTLAFSSGQQFDFAVTANGREIWRWSAGKAFIQMLTSITLAPGEKKTFTAAWPQKDNQGGQVKAGEYALEAFLTSQSAPKTAVGPVAVTVKPKR